MYDTICRVGLFLFFSGGLFFLLFLSSRTKPMIASRCRDCGEKNKDWEIVPTGHDDFGWQHKCKKVKQ